MTFTFSKKWLFLPGLALLVVGGLVAHALEGASIEYPLGVWRMDLDDLLANIAALVLGVGTLLIGIAAFIKAREALRLSQRNESTINGGMTEAAKAHMQEALDHAEIEPGLWKRVDALEQDRDLWEDSAKECLEREAKMRVFMADVYERFDAVGLGRRKER